MRKAFKKTSEKYLTERKFQKFETSFESNMRSIAQSFDRLDASLKTQQEILQIMLKEIRAIHEDNKYFWESISNLNTDGSSYDRKIDNLTVRVEKLEMKAK